MRLGKAGEKKDMEEKEKEKKKIHIEGRMHGEVGMKTYW
jgi:hypothetical protein